MYRFGFIFIFFPTVASACEFCSTSAVVDEARAACFAEIFEDRLARMQRSDRGFIPVDLDSCALQSVKDDVKRGVGTALSDPSGIYAEGGNLILAEEQMFCLKKLIEEKAGALDPGLLLRVPFEC